MRNRLIFCLTGLALLGGCLAPPPKGKFTVPPPPMPGSVLARQAIVPFVKRPAPLLLAAPSGLAPVHLITFTPLLATNANGPWVPIGQPIVISDPVGAASFRLVGAYTTTNMPSYVKVAWDPLPGAAGYNVYYGAHSRAYTDVISAGVATSAVATNISWPSTNYFAVTDYDSGGLESDYSAEAVYVALSGELPVLVVSPEAGSTPLGPWTPLAPFFALTNPPASIRLKLAVTAN